ncbi:indole-3-glycerol phosphate synthase [Actinoplanes derwentensis]|uniref:indole-3-glycerol-phosphate synthase n=1 Tax=Actinoplanes derwentensis TaxID=113562 RepID=A0A1H1RAX8_9ACTN|nr:indole-3-glycerol phosphate synthase [Actinoplanes derwentensis]GID88060.1 indole-3-glycerol-phosphate synthase [Actinoplanes derwentensis]SDS32858.1 indole-3-glycerol phosphate synthase [Actinoplanes derwentensis]
MSGFLSALLSAELPLIMEIKPRDPDGTDLLGGRSAAEVVDTYERAGAPCLSVVTGHWFGGSADLLREVTRRTGKPVLQKDFITRREQLATARDLGASAVLLTAGLLPSAVLARMVTAALAAGLTPFVEVTTEREIAAVPHAGECVLAVNNKDIKVRERGTADLTRSAVLLPALLAAGTRCPVSASGIRDATVAAGLLGQGFAGLLIGTSLLRSTDVTAWADEVRRLRR